MKRLHLLCFCMLVFCLATACANAVPGQPDGQGGGPEDGSMARAGIAPVWLGLRARLAADGLSGPEVDKLLATLPPTPTQSPMGRKMRELYKRKFLSRPKTPGQAKPRPTYYRGVVTEANAQTCREFIAANQTAFARAEASYGVPSSIAVALLFVETRLGRVLADVPENAFYTLASMAISRDLDSISDWLVHMPGHAEHPDWFAEIMPRRADWAYNETRALVRHMLEDKVRPEDLPGSIYGAVGLCQFMPSNIRPYGADGNADGRVELFTVPDAVASLSNYLVRHGWKGNPDRVRQHALLMSYNHSQVYANTILALGDLVAGNPAGPVVAGKRRLAGRKAAVRQGGKTGARAGKRSGQGKARKAGKGDRAGQAKK